MVETLVDHAGPDDGEQPGLLRGRIRYECPTTGGGNRRCLLQPIGHAVVVRFARDVVGTPTSHTSCTNPLGAAIINARQRSETGTGVCCDVTEGPGDELHRLARQLGAAPGKPAVLRI